MTDAPDYPFSTFTQSAEVLVSIKPEVERVILTFPTTTRSDAEVRGAMGAVAMARVASRMGIPVEHLTFSISSASRVSANTIALDKDPHNL